MSVLIQGRVEQVTDITDDIRILRLAPVPEVRWAAGQYMEFLFDDLPARPYSIASAPHLGHLEFHIRRASPAGASARAAQLNPGDPLTLRGPMGRAVVPVRDGGTMVLIAGGTGISSLNAVVDHVLRHDPDARIDLYWGVRQRAELYLNDRFTALEASHRGLRFIPVVESETGRSVIDAVLADMMPDKTHQGALDPERIHLHLSGPRGMVAAAVPLLRDRGVDRARIYCDDDAALNQPQQQRKPA